MWRYGKSAALEKTLTTAENTFNLYWEHFEKMPSPELMRNQIKILEQKSVKKVLSSQNKQIY